MQFYKKKNPLFEDENQHKITFKRRDFCSANVFRNLKPAFISVGRAWQYRAVGLNFKHGVLLKFTVPY